jgi:Domain of unknown function (DUF1707)/Domain of unknown function (DUF4190)
MTVGPGYGFVPADPGRMLASTADRERALDVLKDGFVEGRLTKDEYDTRVSSTYAARTYADLAEVTSDLPGGQSVVAYPPAPPAIRAYPPPGPVYPPYPYPPYQQAQFTYPPVYEPLPKTNQRAVGAMWCGILGLFLGVTSIPAVILGILALRQIRRTGESGYGAATAGLVLGLLGIVVIVLHIVAGGLYYS